jgi:hypothetical protein
VEVLAADEVRDRVQRIATELSELYGRRRSV